MWNRVPYAGSPGDQNVLARDDQCAQELLQARVDRARAAQLPQGGGEIAVAADRQRAHLARSLNTMLGQRPDLASSTLAALRDDLTEFCTHPAPAPAGLEPGAPT